MAKLIEIDETETQLVFTVHGSKVSRIAKKADAEDIQSALAEIMAEAPETKPSEPEEPAAGDGDGDGDIASEVGSFLEGLGKLVNSDEGKKVRGLLEKLPKPKKKGQTG